MGSFTGRYYLGEMHGTPFFFLRGYTIVVMDTQGKYIYLLPKSSVLACGKLKKKNPKIDKLIW